VLANAGWPVYTHTHLTALCPGLPGWASTRKVKPIWILLEQETVSGSGISWTICKSALRCRQITTPAPHDSCFLQAGCTSCCPTNSFKALKAGYTVYLYNGRKMMVVVVVYIRKKSFTLNPLCWHLLPLCAISLVYYIVFCYSSAVDCMYDVCELCFFQRLQYDCY